MASTFKIDFFVIGAARSGTTSLYTYFKQHPEIFLPLTKETNYFSKVSSKEKRHSKKPKPDVEYHSKIINNLEVYKDLFHNATSSQIKGDISPSYMWDKETALRIHKHNPNAKIIFSLRNPIQRAFSHYIMNFNTGHESITNFYDAFMADSEGVWGGGNLYKELSLYYESLKQYYSLFPKENIHSLIFEDWTLNKEESFNALFSFLGIKQMKINDLELHNKNKEYANIKLLNSLRNTWLRPLLQNLFSEDKRTSIKNKLFKEANKKTVLSSTEEDKIKELFSEDVTKTSSLIGIDLNAKWNL
ncbi:sulfotransferase family protein [Patiriisocius hiemis]|uniref:Sulfotransferase n=1 Tax=Patiriisocius hiemis TaxID=3075604 RepID=A0ABU2YD19_9FLAO|nr:sulfotransferase [Constantimarinum sp. W242]MDT0555569.1 sulfotransferase [Constantimarinum sp. W242]